MAIDLNQSPYFDDFDSSKNYLKTLFRPSYAVQARELTQIQTTLQNQVTQFGKNIFKNGSLVTGGQTTLETHDVYYVAIEETDPNGVTIDLTNFIGSYIIDGDGDGVRAYVIAGQVATDTTPTVLVVKYTSGQQFDITTTNPISTDDGTYSASLLVDPTVYTGITTTLGDASICSINDGVFFIDGYFVQVTPQTVILDAFGKVPSYRVGLQIDDAIVDANDDSSLLDPAQGSTNYQAPGANRYQYNLTLSKRSLTSTDDSQFIELLRVVDGVVTKKIVYPTYSHLEDTMARRTNDQSGSFTVRPFKIALESHPTYSNAYNVMVEAGKAYVQGYEFETIAPIAVKAERARTVANVYNYGATIDYQNYLDVTNLVGPVPLTTLQFGVLHCVSVANVATTNTAVASNTAIGTIRIRALDYQSGANSTSISTAVWRAYTFYGAVGSSLAANSAATGLSNTIYLAPNFSAIANAYQGVKLTVTANAGVAVNETHTIHQYDGPTNRAILADGDTFSFGIPGTMTKYRLDYEMKDAESIVYANNAANAAAFTISMDVSSASKYSAAEDEYRGTFISETNFNKLLIQLPYAFVADQSVTGGTPLTNSEYYGRKNYPGQSFTANVISITSVAGIVSAITGSPVSGTDAIDNILVTMRSPGANGLANNQVINFSTGNIRGNTVTISTAANTSTWTITVPDAGSATADVYVKVRLPYAHTLGSLLRSKSLKLANVANTQGGTSIQQVDSGGLVYWRSQAAGANGAQVNIAKNSNAWRNLRRTGTRTSLYTADGVRLAGLFDLGANEVSDANVAIATNITSRYTFDTGQRDFVYDHCGVILKPGYAGPTGNVVAFVDYYAHSGSGYFTVDSYNSANVAYANIPVYTSATTGDTYQLRDCIDFRPRRQDASLAGNFDEVIYGVSGLNFETDFSYYLPRTDKVILTKDRTFEVIQGIPSLNPAPPADRDNAMTLYILNLPAYTGTTAEIQQKFLDNRRYTMADIGTLERRITNLEYYTSLNLLEQSAKNQEITDDTGANRFKNGILVDAFTGHAVGDVLNDDYHVSMDAENRELRPPYNVESLYLTINESNSSNYDRTGAIISLPYTSNTLIDQPFASLDINVNPFNTVSFIGNIQLDPSSDTWVDTNRIPDLRVNATGDNDAWAALTQLVNNANPNKTFGTTWNSWQTTWTGVSVSTQVREAVKKVGSSGYTITRTTTTKTGTESRTGVTTSFAPSTITQSIGSKVIDVSIVPYIRERGVLFIGKGFAPNTNLWSFFDSQAVLNYCELPNIVKVANTTIRYQDTYQNGESVRVWDSTRAVNTAHALVVLNRNESTHTNVTVVSVTGGDDANVANAYFVSSSNPTFLIGETTGANARISGYFHRSGFVENPNVSSIILSHDIANSNSGLSNTQFDGGIIRFSAGLQKGNSYSITGYNYITRNLTFTGAVTAPATNTIYTLERMSTDRRGEVAGIFHIPSSNTLSFRTGERPFALVDSISGDLADSKTNGSVKYFAQGLLETVQNTVISTRVPSILRTDLTESKAITSSTWKDSGINYSPVCYRDPLAQTFLIDEKLHPSGVQLTGIRLLFAEKDINLPIQVQIRPVVNGFPHSSQALPGSDVSVNPEDIIAIPELTLRARYANTSQNNPFDVSTLYTEILFDSPVYLQQGAEYAVVLITNSASYRIYVSALGQKVMGTSRLISSQPYMGSLFKSQNSSTWTPIQEQDLAFRLLHAQYDPTVVSNVELTLSSANEQTSNVPVDTLYVTATNLVLPNTQVSTYFATTVSATGAKDDFTQFELDENVFFDDTLGRRVAIPTTASSLRLRFLLSTSNRDISPLVDLDRVSVLAIENLINNLTLSNASFTIVNTATGWTTANCTISGGGGSGANAYPVIGNSRIESIVCDAAGSGYTSSPTVTIQGNLVNSDNANCEVIVVGETYPSGGPGLARYITRKVTLADGMDAGDFRVYFAAYKPSTANIYVYYKVLSADDADAFDDKNYQLMTCIGGINNLSLNQQDLKDFVFAPGTNNIASERVQYDTFTSFKYFAIKIVLTATDTTKVPRIRDFRVIAVPALS